MKRYFLVIATVAACLTYIGCSSHKGENKTNPNDSSNYINPNMNSTDSVPPPDTTKRDTSRKDSIR
ncbi:hypothetical protein [Solitalea canadensis]|uniref:Uncharacterized protein n=1 Tax=Solitalea canadensis (strain ATCC 29591 / DSM 3403 / JCM 21819 / LMG 8368 / NBRC 15130 / NCIMB 12057 / USAM 9D) TaxID=929556 RepID=H8KQH6_SOLCM|nr:hypothetical protein [Solitalea canadensis]AFD06592.1 hypothetical protein Solca_1517 [Solitalea canadensis DSM 3403]